jgi:hypothetical protein
VVKAEPPGSVKKQTLRKGFLSTALVTLMSVITVFGAVLLSIQGQTLTLQPIAQQPEQAEVDLIPTAAAATPPPVTLAATTPISDSAELLGELGLTSTTEPRDETPSASPQIQPALTLDYTKAPTPAATAWPCAGGAPIDWKVYIVKKGDTLYSLARRHSVTVYQLVYYNCLTSYQIWIGQRLYLPALPTSTPSTTATSTPSSTPASPDSPLPPPPPAYTPTLTAAPVPSPAVTATATDDPPSVFTTTPTPTLTPSVTAATNPDLTATSTPTTNPTATTITQPTASPTLEPLPPPTPTSNPTP